MTGLNLLAVLVGAIVLMVLGALWYGPLFGKAWMAATGRTTMGDAEGGGAAMAKSYGLTFVGALIASAVMAWVIGAASVTDVVGGAVTGIMIAIGFVATSSLGTVVFEQRPVALYAINTAYTLVGYALVGAVLGAWR